jgi:undecaprenyl-diphosphatase
VPIIHAIVLGLTQGLSEFLPISSSGHLLLVPWLFHWHDFADVSVQKAFDAALHLGTLLAVVVYFGKDLWVYVREGVRLVVKREKPGSPEGRLAWLLVLSAVPGAAAGALFEDKIDAHLGRPVLTAISLIVFGVVLFWADRLAGDRVIETFEKSDAIKVGAAQMLALNPGTSRSGITMTAARWLGFTRDSAARISFLMSVPIIGGAAVWKLAKLAKHGIPHGLGNALVVGVVTAAISGFIAVWGLLKLVRTRSLTPFVVYRVAAGILVLAVAAARG